MIHAAVVAALAAGTTSRNKLAKATGISRASVANWVAGRAKLGEVNLMKVCAALDLVVVPRSAAQVAQATPAVTAAPTQAPPSGREALDAHLRAIEDAQLAKIAAAEKAPSVFPSGWTKEELVEWGKNVAQQAITDSGDVEAAALESLQASDLKADSPEAEVMIAAALREWLSPA